MVVAKNVGPASPRSLSVLALLLTETELMINKAWPNGRPALLLNLLRVKKLQW